MLHLCRNISADNLTFRPLSFGRSRFESHSAGLSHNKIAAFGENCPHVSKVSPMVQSSGQAIYSSRNTPTSLYGINEDYLDIRQLKIKEGSIFSEQDVKSSAKVCVLGQTVIDNLFPNGEDPIGKIIRFNKIPFRIIGTLEAKGTNSMGIG